MSVNMTRPVGFAEPSGVAVTSTGNILIADDVAKSGARCAHSLPSGFPYFGFADPRPDDQADERRGNELAGACYNLVLLFVFAFVVDVLRTFNFVCNQGGQASTQFQVLVTYYRVGR